MEALVLKGVVARRLREEAAKQGLGAEEYLLDLLTPDMDPKDRAREYLEASRELLSEAREELEKDNVRQAADKVWGAAALAIKAYALWRDGRRLASHGELWKYKSVVAEDLGRWVRVAFQQASSMHTCFYEGWCDKVDVEEALRAVERLVKAVAAKVSI